MNALKFLILLVFFKFNFSIAAEPLPFNNIVLHKNPLQVSQVKFKDFDSKDIVLNKNDGKIKILNFWATWCAPCKAEMPSLDKLAVDQNFQNLKILPVNIGQEKTNKIEEFYDKTKIKNLEIFYDTDVRLAKKFLLRGLPTTLIINKDGGEIARVVGSIDFQDKNFKAWLQNFD